MSTGPVPSPRPFRVRDARGFQHANDQYYSFAPPPRSGTIDEMMESARSRGRRVYEPAEFDAIVGATTFPLR